MISPFSDAEHTPDGARGVKPLSDGQARVLACEPQFRGSTHSHFNASLLDALGFAFWDREFTFLSETEHQSCVKESLCDCPALLSRVGFQSVSLPRHGNNVRLGTRLRSEWQFYRQIVRSARLARGLVFCSVSNFGLLVLKLLVSAKSVVVPVVAVIHQPQELVDAGPNRRKRLVFRILNIALGFKGSPAFRPVVLGQPILEGLRGQVPRIGRSFGSIELPCIWGQRTLAVVDVDDDPHVRFGLLGIGRREKGLDAFANLVREATRQNSGARFAVLGQYTPPPGATPLPDVVDVSAMPLDRKSYLERVDRVHYTILPTQPSEYRLRASASFIDTFAAVKPCIAIRNPYLAHYFQLLGDIGYLCDSEEELHQTVLSLAREIPRARYLAQCENVRQGRRLFETKSVGKAIAELF